jgi:hypothetical protein
MLPGGRLRASDTNPQKSPNVACLPQLVHLPNSSGSLAMLTAMRRVSSRVIKWRRGAPAGLVLEIDVGERVAVGVTEM